MGMMKAKGKNVTEHGWLLQEVSRVLITREAHRRPHEKPRGTGDPLLTLHRYLADVGKKEQSTKQREVRQMTRELS